MEVLGSAEISAIPRTFPGRGQPVGRASCDRPGLVVLGAELQPQHVGLLEVIADELVRVCHRRACLEPVREALMQSGPDTPFRQHLVGGVAEQHVMEAEGFLAGDV